jgi:hypothetical protein
LVKQLGAHTVFMASALLMLIWWTAAWGGRYVKSTPSPHGAAHQSASNQAA